MLWICCFSKILQTRFYCPCQRKETQCHLSTEHSLHVAYVFILPILTCFGNLSFPKNTAQ